MRRIWAAAEAMPFAAETIAAAAAAGATEIVSLPVPRLPQLVAGYNEIPDPPADKTISGDVFLERITNEEYGAVLALAASSVQVARWLEIFRLRGSINVLGETALAAKAAFVAAAICSQERADEIFS